MLRAFIHTAALLRPGVDDNVSPKTQTVRKMSEKICLNVREACVALSIGRSTFYEMVRAGRISTIKLGKKTLIARDELVRFVADCSVGALRP